MGSKDNAPQPRNLCNLDTGVMWNRHFFSDLTSINGTIRIGGKAGDLSFPNFSYQYYYHHLFLHPVHKIYSSFTV